MIDWLIIALVIGAILLLRLVDKLLPLIILVALILGTYAVGNFILSNPVTIRIPLP